MIESTRNIYTNETRTRAVELAKATDAKFAAQFLGVNVKTLYSWLNPPKREKPAQEETKVAPVSGEMRNEIKILRDEIVDLESAILENTDKISALIDVIEELTAAIKDATKKPATLFE